MPPNQNEKPKELGRKVEDVASAMRWVIERLGLVQSEVRKQSEIITKLADKASVQKDKTFSVRREIKDSPKIYGDPTQHEEYYIRVIEPGKRCEIAYCHFDERVIDGNKNWTSYFLNFEPKKKVWIPEAPTMGQLRYDNGPDKEAQGPSKPQKTPSQIIQELSKGTIGNTRTEHVDTISSDVVISNNVEVLQEVSQEFVNRLNTLLKKKGNGSGRVSIKGGDGSENELIDAGMGLTLRNTQDVELDGERYVYKMEYYLSFSLQSQKWSVKPQQISIRAKDKKPVAWNRKVAIPTMEKIVTTLEQ